MAGYGQYKYQSPEVRALSSITTEGYDKDQAKNLIQLNKNTAYMAQYMRKMQQGIDSANANVLEQIQSFVNDIIVLLGGGDAQGLDFGDLRYVLQMFGALLGFNQAGGIAALLPLNAFNAIWHMLSTTIFPTGAFKEVIDAMIDGVLGQLLTWLGDVPIVGEAVEQLAEFVTVFRDDFYWLVDLLTDGVGDIVNVVEKILTKVFDQFIQPLIDFINRAVGGPFGRALDSVRDVLSKIFNLASGADSKATQALKAARPLWETLDGNGETSCALSTSDTLMTINASTARGGFIRCAGGDIKRTISCIASKSGTVTTLHLDIYSMNSANGVDLVYTSPDQSSLLLGTETVLFHEIPEELGIASNQNSFYLVVARMTGSGSVSLQGRVFPTATTANRPLYSGFSRNPTVGSPAPASILSGTLDGYYVKETPYFQLGAIDDILPQSFFVDFTTLSENLWIKKRYFTGGLGDPTYLAITGGTRLYMPAGGANGLSAIVHKYRSATNRCRAGVRVGSPLTSANTYLTLFSKLDFSSQVSLAIKETQIVLGKGTHISSPAATVGAGFTAPDGLDIEVGDWVWLEYRPDDQSFRVYVNPDFEDPDYWTTPLIYTSDPAFVTGIPMDSAARSSAIIMSQITGGARGFQVDDWILEDYPEPEVI